MEEDNGYIDGADVSLELNGNVAEAGLAISKSKKRKLDKRKEMLERTLVQDAAEMKMLQNNLFASIHSPVQFGKQDDVHDDDDDDDTALFFVDRYAKSQLSAYEEDVELFQGVKEEKTDKKKPVWVDEEEEQTNVDIAKVNRLRKLRKEEDERLISGAEYVSRLRAHHAKVNPNTDWARLDSRSENGQFDYESSDEEDKVEMAHGYENVEAVDDILRTTDDLVVKGSAKLLPGFLEYSKLVDANSQEPANGAINSVQFHRNAQLLLTAGLDNRVRFFQIDGKRNTKVQSIFLEDCPVKKASFLPDGSQVIITGRRKFFYSFDLVKAKVDKISPLVGREEKSLETFEVSPNSNIIAFGGNEGYILLVSTKTKELIGTLKMNGTVRSLSFADDGNQLLSNGGDGQIYHWDLRTRTCIHKADDEGGFKGTSLCTSPNGSLFAAGSYSGVVNIYNRKEFLGGKRRPMKTIDNLTSKINFMKFNHDAQLLAMCSKQNASGIRLVHIPSFTVFSNWPPPNSSMGLPRCLDFSPGGGFMAVGNTLGNVLLYKLHHYQHA
ncbi:hypothetical protein ACFE04_031755 [Oxalis oulophora]